VPLEDRDVQQARAELQPPRIKVITNARFDESVKVEADCVAITVGLEGKGRPLRGRSCCRGGPRHQRR
jgi:hypothetical protein